MRRRHTRQTDPVLAGKTTQRAIRLPEVQVEAVRGAIASGLPDIHNVTDAVTDALWLWLYENERSNGSLPEGHTTVALPRVKNEPEMIQTVSEPESIPEPTEADHAYQGTSERPKWADVDMAALDGDG